MKKLAEFINESTLVEARETGKASDTEGKLHELLTGYHLNGGKHMESYREEGKTPEAVHDSIKASLPKQSYDRINKHAKEMADKIKDHLKSSGYKGKIHKTVWTSQTKDIEHFTGKKDPNNESDVMIHYKHAKGSSVSGDEHLGFSMKYADNAPTLKNKSPKTMADTYGMDHQKLMKHHDAHMNDIAKHLPATAKTGVAMHAAYKALRGTKKGEEIETSSNESRKKMIGELHSHLSKKTPEELHSMVMNHISGETNSKVLMAHTTSTGKHHITDTREHYKKILDEHKPHLKVTKGEGTSMSITGKDGVKLLGIQAVSKGRPTKTPEFIANPGAALMGGKK